ncbi:restriction endonuclease subunit M [Candidatus Gracilibacteria bacterium]|nr:restriction endonuclease subunit M [Candidatus Gracilibacteria bacterium]
MNVTLLDQNKITATFLFNECLDVLGINQIQAGIGLNIGTIKRWISQNKVPDNYLNDLNFLLGNKYKLKNTFREKDQFYTTKKISKYCFEKTLEVLKDLDINEEEYTFIEPSAGCCNFYNILPKQRRIGIDIEPKGELANELIKDNYLDFFPKDLNKKYIVIGNPPFGLRGNLALRFINHSLDFADVVSFILPPLFDSDGKGVPKKRIKGYELAYTEKLPLNSFEYPDGKEVEVATIFQVWTKKNTHKIKILKQDSCKSFIKVYSLSDGGTPGSTRNKNMLDKCDVYLPSTCFKGMKAYNSFEELPNRRGYGIVFLQDKRKLKDLFFYKINWEKVSFLSTNSALNLRTSLIEQEVVNAGFKDLNLIN